jgi:predicted nucleotidyltransferase
MSDHKIWFDVQQPTIIPAGLSEPIGVSLPQAIERIIHELKPEKIILFGSFAYGKPDPDSDVDLLIIMDTEDPTRERTWKVSRLLLPRKFPVDILVRTPEEIEQALEGGGFFIQEILERGNVLYERIK